MTLSVVAIPMQQALPPSPIVSHVRFLKNLNETVRATAMADKSAAQECSSQTALFMRLTFSIIDIGYSIREKGDLVYDANGARTVTRRESINSCADIWSFTVFVTSSGNTV